MGRYKMYLKPCLILAIVNLMWVGSGYASDDPVALIRDAIRQYAEAVQTQDVDSIVALVPESGLSDADQFVSRESINAELQDEGSYLYQNLFVREPIQCREPGGFAPVSDATYFDNLDDINQIKITKSEDFDSYYTIAFPRLNVEGCKIWRFYNAIVIEDGRAYFHDNFAR